jgi:GT2 family glycosyltransferase
MEEIDLCWRLRRKGRKIGYVGNIKVFHLGGATLDRGSGKKLYLNIRNSLSMIFKNVNWVSFGLIFLVKWFLESAAAVGYLLTGKTEFAKAIVLGYWDFLKNIHLLHRPKEKGPEPRIGTGPVGLLFFNVKVLGKQKFSDL